MDVFDHARSEILIDVFVNKTIVMGGIFLIDNQLANSLSYLTTIVKTI